MIKPYASQTFPLRHSALIQTEHKNWLFAYSILLPFAKIPGYRFFKKAPCLFAIYEWICHTFFSAPDPDPWVWPFRFLPYCIPARHLYITISSNLPTFRQHPVLFFCASKITSRQTLWVPCGSARSLAQNTWWVLICVSN